MAKNRPRGARFPLQMLVICSLLAALSLLCGKLLAISVGNMLRFSLENLPILLAGMLFGPLAGMLVGIIADLIGCLTVGYTINPLVTLGAAVIGLLGGYLYRWLLRVPSVWRILLTVVMAHLVGSVVIKTVGLAQYYDMPFALLTWWRFLNYIPIATAETAILHVLMKNAELRRMGRQDDRLSGGDDTP